mmetsp:Transcript_19320/g.44025  ORF Transcript_19320/g.44025 Transcript_19320/m.44025 type:complete len:298 (-) Transcript_19320:210-1103(-)
MGIPPGGVHDQQPLVISHGFGEGLGTLRQINLSERRSLLFSGRSALLHLRNHGIDGGGSVPHGPQRRCGPVDHYVPDEPQQLLRPILAGHRHQQLGVVGDEAGVHRARQKDGVLEQVQQEGFVGGHPPDAKFAEGADQFGGGVAAGGGAAGDFGQEGVVVGGYFGTGEAGSVVDADSHASGHAEDVDCAGVRTEVVGGIFRGDTTLHSITQGGDIFLSESQIIQSGTSGNSNLILHNIHPRDFFGNGVFHLYAWIDFNKIMSAHAVHQKLYSTGIFIFCRGQQPNGIVEKSLTRFIC